MRLPSGDQVGNPSPTRLLVRLVWPGVLFKMLLVGYLYGITSERRLAREAGLHLAYRWFPGYDLDEPTPDHSVLSKARARLGSEVFEEFFRRSIDLCRQAGLLSEGPVYVDTTLMRAAASMDSLVERDESGKPPLSMHEYVQRLYADNDSPPQEGAPPSSSSASSQEVAPRYGLPGRHLGPRALPLSARGGCLPLPCWPAFAAVQQREAYTTGLPPGTEG